jgi:hypothetical protein
MHGWRTKRFVSGGFYVTYVLLHGTGCDVAMASIERKKFQQWPFFSVQVIESS